jgi:hypothetical protein
VRRVELWNTPTASSGGFPSARRDPDKFRGATRADRMTLWDRIRAAIDAFMDRAEDAFTDDDETEETA